MGANPHANGGLLLKDLQLPDFRELRRDVAEAGSERRRSHARAREHAARCDEAQPASRGNFRVFGPDETASNRLNALFEVTDRTPRPKFFPTTITSRPTAA